MRDGKEWERGYRELISTWADIRNLDHLALLEGIQHHRSRVCARAIDLHGLNGHSLDRSDLGNSDIARGEIDDVEFHVCRRAQAVAIADGVGEVDFASEARRRSAVEQELLVCGDRDGSFAGFRLGDRRDRERLIGIDVGIVGQYVHALV